MSRYGRLTALIVVLCLSTMMGTALAQDQKKAEGQPSELAADPMMELMMKYGTPGPEHAELQKMVGTWNTTSTFWMAPDAEPMTSTGTAEMTSILGGRWIQQSYTGDMGGQMFHGIGFIGYDLFKKQYVSTWMDDMSTMIMVSYGTGTPDGKVITYTGVSDDIMTGQKNKTYKSVAKNIDENNATFEMYDTTADGKEFRMMEIKYTRGK